MLVAATAGATTIVMPTDAQLIEKSPVIVRGTVVSSTPIAHGDAIRTETILEVHARIKGDAPAVITIRETGGILGDRITKIYGSPEYVAGEQVLAFLAETPRGDYQTVDLFAGKFSAEEVDGQTLWVRTENEPHVDLLDADLEPLPANTLQRDAKKFETYVSDRVAGRHGNPDYAVRRVRNDGLRSEENFTLIAEPTVYRWFAFDTGTRVSWRSAGTQPGYGGGGINEVRSGMSSWTGYADARILYSYDGTFSTAPAGLDRSNGINEILLNDPLSEIVGSFNPATGGVVGRGGFNGVSSSRTWTSPFAADSTHQGTFRAWDIVEGNLVIQDGVTPSAGMSSNRLAEIIAHEFGHTLGLGHSADGGALMYSSVTGVGPALRDDDRLAARWLYPVISSTPTPQPKVPAAPSSLGATVSGTSVQLQWNDNASDELGQSIYYAAGSGSFAKEGDVAAGQRSANLTGFKDGTWRFYVTAFNSAGESSPSNTASVTISTTPVVPLVAGFTWSPASPVADDPVSFTDTSTGGVTSRQWNFGDGSSSTQPTPVKRYASSGTYTVTLIVYRGSESRVVSKSIPVASRAPALPPVETYRSVIPVSSQSEGIGGSVWRTELTLFNAGTEGTNVTLVHVPGAGGSLQSRAIFVGPRQTLTYANALRDVFGMSSGAGAIAIEATGATATPLLKVTSRTFNEAAGGTYGLAVPDINPEDLHQTLFIAGMTENSEYRTNVGLVNRSGSAVSAALTLFGSNGAALASSTVSVPATSFQQNTIAAFFPPIAGQKLTGMSMRVSASTANALSAYASVVDNRTHDPLYISASRLPVRREAIVPVVGRSPGANGTFWRSDVTLFNPGSGWLPVTLRYGGKNKSLVLMANETAVIPDIVDAMGFDSGTGTLVVTWDNSTGPIVTTRNYTPAPGGGTYGQSIEPAAAFTSETYVTGLRSDASFRANVGFVNGGTSAITLQVTLIGSTGGQMSSAVLSLNPDQLVQTSVAALFPAINAATLGSFTLHARSSAAGLFAYGSVIDNASGDPVFFGGR
ncbi:MAG: PKD domain-containing protein [Thermoanaerobaculia bacterium]